MKKIYTALAALGLALGANAQTPIYTLDSTFSADGIASFGAAGNVSAEGTGIAENLSGIWVAGKLVTAGGANTSHFVSRFLSNGTFDNAFATNGTAAYTASGNIPSAIRDLHALRYSSVYAAFSGGGGFQSSGATLQNYTYTPNPTGTAVTSTARMNDSLVVFLAGSDIEVMKGGVAYASFPWFNSGSHYGSLPSSVAGLSSVNYQKVAAQSDGKILLAGLAANGNNLFILRLKNKETSELDSTFGINGAVTYITGNQVPGRDVSCLQVYPNGDDRIVLGYGNFMYRFSANGTRDNAFNAQIPDNDERFTRIAFDAYTNIVAIGKTSTTSTLYAFKNDGSPLNSFHKGKNTYLKTDADINLNTMDLLDVKIDGGSNVYVSGSLKETSTSDPKVLIMKLKVSLCTEPGPAPAATSNGANFVIFNAVRPTVVIIRDGDGGIVVNDTIKTGTGTASVSYSNLFSNTTYSYTVINPDGCSKSGTFTTLTGQEPNAINDLNVNAYVTLYPNPAKNTLRISSEITFEKVQITNVIGAIVKAEALNNNSIDISELKPGVYFAKLTDSKGTTATKKFIKE
jgi:hypothetical protein